MLKYKRPDLFAWWRDPLYFVKNFVRVVSNPNFPELMATFLSLDNLLSHKRDSKIWRWRNKALMVKSFYVFLSDSSLDDAQGKTF